jgi:hypothetical protein
VQLLLAEAFISTARAGLPNCRQVLGGLIREHHKAA